MIFAAVVAIAYGLAGMFLLKQGITIASTHGFRHADPEIGAAAICFAMVALLGWSALWA